MKERMNLAAAFLKLGWSLNAMSRFVYKDTPLSAYSNMRSLMSDHRIQIAEINKAITLTDAERFVRVTGAIG